MSTSTRFLYSHLALAALLAVAVWLLLIAPAPSQAGGCAVTYTVQAGDTLSAIAQKNGLGMQALARLNRLHRPYRLRTGQVLCLSANAKQSAASTSRGMVSLELGTQFGLYDPERHIEFRLGGSDDSVVLRNSTDELRDAIPDDAPVVLWLSHNPRNIGYTLSVVDNTTIFDQLQLAVVASDVFTDVYKLARTSPNLGQVTELKVWVEDDTGTRLPFDVGRIGRVASLADARSRQPNVYLAVAGDAPDNYRLYAVVGKDNAGQSMFGPPGEDRQTKCSRWVGRRGILYALLRRWHRC